MTTTKTSYKDSGITWIGNIPDDFNVSKLKFVFKYITGATPDSGKNGYYGGNNNWITISDLDGKYTGESKNKITDLAVKEKNMKIVHKGSLLYSFKLSVGQLAFVSEDTYTNEAIFAILEKEGLNLDFWYYALGSYFINNANENIYGAKIFNQFVIDNGLVIVPPLSTQTIIANYLDTKTNQINEFITKKKQLISLLQEQKQAIIHQAVTKGVDPSANMKDSGIVWIGEIPEEWEVVKLKYLGKIRSGEMIESSEIKIEGEYEIYGGNGFIGYANKYNSQGEAIVIGRVGAKCGNVRYIAEKKRISDNALIITLFQEREYYDYISTILDIMNLNSLSVSNAQPLITGTGIMNQFIPLPSAKEQQKILSYIKSRTSKIDQAIAKIEQEIDLIQEYRTSLIYHVVTGKINIK